MSKEKKPFPWFVVVSWFGVSAGLVVADLGRFYGLTTIGALLLALALIVSSFILRRIGGLRFQAFPTGWQEYFASWILLGCLAMLFTQRVLLGDILFNALLFALSLIWIGWGDRHLFFSDTNSNTETKTVGRIQRILAPLLFVFWGVFVMQIVWTF